VATAEDRIVHAEPTKRFFVEMLVRDIDLKPAISDLVDNTVDGARRIRPDGQFGGLAVRIVTTATEFRIEDNCGGIPVDIARNYAFRFGRAEGMEPTKHSIGQFGVGMKRALFKIGSKFSVASRSADDVFRVDVDVPSWVANPAWQFEFSELRPRSDGDDHPGTIITVSSLHPETSEDLCSDHFISELCSDLKRQHQDSLAKGLVITVNGAPISGGALEFLVSESIQPARIQYTMDEESDAPLTVIMYAGISNSVPRDAGWYVYCNGRLVLGADQTLVTGWGEADEARIPKYHNQFARFRGYAFFDCDDANKLPWTTTKTGVNQGSPVYKRARLEILTIMRPVIDFLNELDREKDSPPEDQSPLEAILGAAGMEPVASTSHRDRFSLPVRPKQPPKPRQISIQYKRDIDERVKEILGLSSAVDVGQRTFEYFFERECEE
jgi:Histidine kinase-, DNA gyrase B-, and HSP90-like ATPase